MSTTTKSISKLFFPTVIISDLHLGKSKVVEAERLLEFLETVECNTLVLNGDIIDGWHIERKKNRPLPEMHARILDAINKKAAQGTRVIYIPGNHDERLRFETRKKTLEGAFNKEYPVFDKPVSFGSVSDGEFEGKDVSIEFKSSMIFRDQNDQNILIKHGDDLDSLLITLLSKSGDVAYEGLLTTSAALIYLQDWFQRKQKPFSLAKLVKRLTKKSLGIIDKFEKAAANLPDGIDRLAAGHIHWPNINGRYMNSGDWIDSCSALVQDEEGQWKILDWMDEREKFGFNGVGKFGLKQPNPNADMRPITERQMRFMHRFWPGKNKSKILSAVREERASYESLAAEKGEEHRKTVAAKARLEAARSKVFPMP